VQLLMMLAGLMTIFPDSAIGVGGVIDAAGVVLGLLLLAYEYRSVRRTAQAPG
jgi:hypothetical protein